MRITRLNITAFRNIPQATLHTHGAQMVFLYGDNGMGKTNLLEAISLLSPGRGLHKDSRDEQVQHGEEAWAIHAIAETHEGSQTIGMAYHNGQKQRKIKINDKPAVSQTALAALGNVLWFTPKMDRLFLDNATARRDFFDRLTFSLFPEYLTHLNTYKHHLKGRLRLIKAGQNSDWIAAEEQQIATFGLKLLQLRHTYLQHLLPYLQHVMLEQSGSALKLLHDNEAYLTYLNKLADTRQRDFLAGMSTFGPHRSDIDGVLSLAFAPTESGDTSDDTKYVRLSRTSTGQHKRALLYILLAHARLIHTHTGTAPVILLDEFNSHLDAATREHFFSTLATMSAQIWMTGTDSTLAPEKATNTLFIKVEKGTFTPQI